MHPKITVVTVNLNGARFLEETLRSVLQQNYPHLEYIVIDGGSTDGSVEIIKKYESRLAYWESQPDEGYAFALQKGFSRATGEIMAWLNADDVYLPGSLFVVAHAFRKHPGVKWLTGFPSWSNARGMHLAEMPLTAQARPYWAKRYDLYEKYARWSRIRYLGGDFLAIQQESTFWKRELWEKAGARINTGYKLAADTELWCRFFRHEQLHTVNALLAAFRSGSERQLTNVSRAAYLQECQHALEEERHLLGFGDFTATMLQFFMASFCKPFYYFDLPLAGLYARLLQLPEVIRL